MAPGPSRIPQAASRTSTEILLPSAVNAASRVDRAASGCGSRKAGRRWSSVCAAFAPVRSWLSRRPGMRDRAAFSRPPWRGVRSSGNAAPSDDWEGRTPVFTLLTMRRILWSGALKQVEARMGLSRTATCAEHRDRILPVVWHPTSNFGRTEVRRDPPRTGLRLKFRVIDDFGNCPLTGTSQSADRGFRGFPATRWTAC